jgi:hypothetical protein
MQEKVEDGMAGLMVGHFADPWQHRRAGLVQRPSRSFA